MPHRYVVTIERQHTARIPFERWCATIHGCLQSDCYVFAMTRRGLDRAIARRIRQVEAGRATRPEKVYVDA